ncbi:MULTISPECIES: hypothetical protein [Trichocoleus]|uniref:Uncharacterized protein n=1 Tax=Trichocoleus desertorum GB2-A4 TaxID=2933944 RepID=A0ABV0JHB5_9CYAN|nr:hypothetical protein [Trichocoleus sp. FACHB-46]MBD1860051.1 hypothetical protein [Trichocoleus sp. FACHB-46]
MWFADIYCDHTWVSKRNGVLGEKRLALSGPRSISLGIAVDFHFFGDDDSVRHVRVLMHTDDQQLAQTCLNLNLQTWVAALEVAVMMETGRPFQIERLPGSLMFAIWLSQGSEDSPACVMNFERGRPSTLNYEKIALAMVIWNGDVTHHLFYLRRFIDESLPLDVRWLNGYRMLEWHFVGKKAGLAKSPSWRSFVERFDDLFKPLLRSNQSSYGLIEEARALAAHAGADERSDAERQREPQNAMEKTFQVLEQMIMTVLNEHLARVGSPIRFQDRIRSD